MTDLAPQPRAPVPADAPGASAAPVDDAAGGAPDVLVVPHTHWDREWYHPVGRFRQRLVALVDERLDDADDAPFLLDGQAIVLEDYLAVRPERRDALVAALRAGRLEAGPWYVLADNLIPGGEALVRNLLAGRRVLRALGADAPAVCHAPDAFGHPAALPTLAAGFGLPVAIVWRGYGGARWPAGDAARWRGPDGSDVLLVHLPPDGYEFGSRLPAEAPAAAARWGALRDVLAPRARLGALLVLNGADHHARQERWAAAIDALRDAAAPARVTVTSLGGAAARLLAGARALAPDALPVVSGELRDSYGYTWTLQGTFGTRAQQKRRVARAERRLVRDVEPWLALLRLRGAGAPADDVRRAALLDAAWRPFLQCLPHDTLCGCSTDEVARAMDARLDDADAQSRGLRADALERLVGHDAVAARAARERWAPWLLVRNRAARPRGGVAEVSLVGTVRDVGVGPGSAGAWRAVHEAPARVAPDGPMPVQELERVRRHDRVESPRHYPDDDLVDDVRAVAWVPPVPAYGIAAHALRAPGGAAAAPGAAAASTTGPLDLADGPRHPVRASDLALDNGRVRVEADARGRVRVTFAERALVLDDCLGFEDVGDAGDCYTPSPVGAPRTVLWCTDARLRHRGPLRGAITLAFRMRVPAGLEPTPDGFSRPARPTRGHVELPIEVELSLDADAPFVRVGVRGENHARDHRLRLALRTGLAGGVVRADAAFGPVVRAPLDVPPEERARELPPATAPLHRWVALDGATASVALVSDGLAEYEATADGRLLVTLVRAVGELSRPDLPERPGHAGWPVPTPGAQCPGPFAARVALAAYAPWADDPLAAARLDALAEDVLLPLTGDTLRAAVAAPASVTGIALEGEGLACAAIRPADDGRSVALRCVNLSEVAVSGAWLVAGEVAAAELARLDETPLAPLAVVREGAFSRVAFAAGPRAVVTILVRAAT